MMIIIDCYSLLYILILISIKQGNETVDQVQAAQKRLLKLQKKKKKADKNNIAHKILTGIPLEINSHFKLSEHEFDNVSFDINIDRFII
jgi:hypothetical protein